ncbi:hypothetical protein [Fluviispira vulneris]|uniref:hypothetical protein n=1 Tax=Fluviispira vulneris TaxID=2763012 RepID=UPI0016475131|nr:hypothetical protein [Fluviispira vulneris]
MQLNHKSISRIIHLGSIFALDNSQAVHGSYLHCSSMRGIPRLRTQFNKPDEVRVYCSRINKQWNFLSDGNFKVHGIWKSPIIGTFTYFYFINNGGEKEIKD